jgi:hypothetical protein
MGRLNRLPSGCRVMTTEESPQNPEKDEDARNGPRETLADDLIRAEFAELCRQRANLKDAGLKSNAAKGKALEDNESKSPSGDTPESGPRGEE